MYFSKSIWRRIIRFKKEAISRVRVGKTKRKFRFIKRIFYDRASAIPASFKGVWMFIHKGKKERQLLVHKYNIGYKFGEFGYTRKPFHFPVRKKKGNRIRR